MGFILLAGITLMMGLFAKVKPLKDASKGLVGLRVPIGIVAFFSGLAAFRGGARFVFPATMGIIAGIFLVLDLIKLIPKAETAISKAEATLTAVQVPVGILAAIAAIIGMFM